MFGLASSGYLIQGRYFQSPLPATFLSLTDSFTHNPHHKLGAHIKLIAYSNVTEIGLNGASLYRTILPLPIALFPFSFSLSLSLPLS